MFRYSANTIESDPNICTIYCNTEFRGGGVDGDCNGDCGSGGSACDGDCAG